MLVESMVLWRCERVMVRTRCRERITHRIESNLIDTVGAPSSLLFRIVPLTEGECVSAELL